MRETIPRFFIDSDQLVSIAAPLFLVAAAFQLFDGIQVVSQGALRGLQDIENTDDNYGCRLFGR